MRAGLLLVLAGIAWLGAGPLLARAMKRRGHHGPSWLVVGATLGPVALAFIDRFDAPVGGPEVVVRGSRGDGHIRVLLSVDHGEDVAVAAQPVIRTFEGHLEHVCVVRVLPTGSPAGVREAARAVLSREAHALAGVGARAELLLGLTDDVLVDKARNEHFQIVITANRDERLAAKLRSTRARYLGGRAEADRMVTRQCLAFPEARARTESG